MTALFKMRTGAKLEQLGLIPSRESSTEFAARAGREIAGWITVAKGASIKLD